MGCCHTRNEKEKSTEQTLEEKKPDRKRMPFVIHFLNEENFVVEGFSDWTVNMLKQEIMKQQGVPADDQYIYHNELVSDDTVIGGIKWKELKHAAMGEDQKKFKEQSWFVSKAMRVASID